MVEISKASHRITTMLSWATEYCTDYSAGVDQDFLPPRSGQHEVLHYVNICVEYCVYSSSLLNRAKLTSHRIDIMLAWPTWHYTDYLAGVDQD